MKISHFYTTKNSMIEPTCELFNRWKQMNRTVTILRMDNAGENKLLDKRLHSKDWKLDITASVNKTASY
jgi:flagellar biosynthesis/type III secretory pathway chaperone